MGLPLVTLAEYKAYVGIANPKEDAEIELLIPKISAYVKKLCRRTFIDYATTDKVEVSNGGFRSILTSEYPILSVSSVQTSSDYGVTYTPFTDYVVDSYSDEIVCIAGTFPEGINAVKVAYKAGFTEIPEDLKLAVCDLITYYRKNDASIHSTKAPGTNAVQIEYITSSALPIHIRRVLELYVADYT